MLTRKQPTSANLAENNTPTKSNQIMSASSKSDPETFANSRSDTERANKTTSSLSKSNQDKNEPMTRITIKYDAGFPNSLYIRGKGAGLSWEKGILLKNLKADEWVWETRAPFTTCEFKIVINDQTYELGENHSLSFGNSIQHIPTFPQ